MVRMTIQPTLNILGVLPVLWKHSMAVTMSPPECAYFFLW